jgi:hypothetical protein
MDLRKVAAMFQETAATRLGLVCAALMLPSAAGAALAEPTAADPGKARAAVAGLGEKLKGELLAALKSGGPIEAVSVCKTVAPALAAEASETSGVTVRRTALKVRNSGNAPDEFERRVLEDFAAKIAAGADAAKLEHAEVVDAEGRRLMRYMKAIPMAAEPCSVCHGVSVAPELKAHIDGLYPNDQAVGFKPGELRGAFSVVERLP